MEKFQVKIGFSCSMSFFGIFLLLSSIGISMPSVAEDITTSVREVRTIEATNLGVSTLSGLGYSTQNGGSFIVTGREAENSSELESDPLKIPPQKMIGLESFAIVISDSRNIAFDDTVSRLLVHRVSRSDIAEFEVSSNGDLSPALLGNITLGSLGIQNLKGMDFDPSGGRFFLLDGDAQRVVVIKPDAASRFADAAITELNLANLGLGKLTAIAFNPSNGLLYLFDASDMMVKELSVTGELKKSYDFSGFGLKNPGAMVFAPSGDQTDDASVASLYLVDHGSNKADLITEGQGIIEFSLILQAATSGALRSAAVVSVPTVPAFLVQTIDASLFVPPSPDSAGITYLESTDTFLITDSEVNEIPSLFTGVNVFEADISGVLQNTFSTTAYSLEPTGISINPNNNHFFVSDDNVPAIFEIDPGSDGIRGTADDIVTSFDTTIFGSLDPEGVTYASNVGQGDLFIVDGMNDEVYHIAPGSNGIFDGQPPAGDDILVGSFDTAVHGVFDPEGIEYDLANGTLYISSGRDHSLGDPIIETDVNGNLVRIIDASGVNYNLLSGIALAPGSQNPNIINMFLADRGVDNDTDPDENDGRIHELTFNQVPTVNAGVDQAIVLPNTVVLNGSVTDDGLPPSAVITVDWSQVSGPGIVTFADLNSLNTTASFTQDGIYVLRLTANDGLGQSTDDITITATHRSGSQVYSVSTSLAASSDDAEERPTGAIADVTGTDLEMVRDVGEDQTVGLRFSGLGIPQGVVIQNAYIQFIVDEDDDRTTTLLIEGENTDYAVPFFSVAGDISNRARTNASTSWAPVPWLTVGEAGIDQRTANIAPIIQEIINRPGWSSNNALAFIVTGDGKRVARSYDYSAINAPSLHVDYVGVPVNQAPIVDAGADQTIILPSVAVLDGTVTDDNLPNPPGQVTVSWSMVSGAGTVTFTDPASEDTTVSFSQNGNYVLRLTADDGGAPPVSDDLRIVVSPAGSQVFSVSTSIAMSSDDAEERPAGVVPDLTGTDLEMVRDVGVDQTVGLRFSGLDIPQGASIQNAYIQFIVDEDDDRATALLIEGEDADNAVTFSSVAGDISNRTRTNASVSWAPIPWLTIGEAGIDQRTADIAPIIREIVNRPNWSSNNALAFIVTGDGKRVARSFDFSAINAPTLHVDYIGLPVNQVPVVNAGADQNIILPSVAVLDGTVTDDDLPNPPGQLTVSWSKVSGPGTVTFADPASEDTTVSFSKSGNYVLRLTTDDGGGLPVSDDLNVVVSPEGSQVFSVSMSIATSSDDAEERPVGAVSDLTGTDLEMVRDTGEDQTVGLRFSGLGIPQGVVVQNAYIQFIVDEVDDRATTLLIEGEDTDDAVTFSSVVGDISNRSRVNASVSWSPVPWLTIGEAGIDQRTTNIAPIIEEIIGRPGWLSDNGLVLMVTGDGKRVARSYDFSAINAPSLVVEYVIAPNQAPVVDAGADQSVILPADLTLDGTVTDDGLPNPPGQISVNWSKVSGPGAVTFADPVSEDTTASFSQGGNYILSLTADDGSGQPVSDDIAITVSQTVIVSKRIAAGSDDAEERPTGASPDLTSNDLEMTRDHGENQTVGLRFSELDIPQGATIQAAYIQFKTDEDRSRATVLLIEGENSDDALTFTNMVADISSRPKTNASVSWSPVPWEIIDEEGINQRTTDIAVIIQEIVNRPGWLSGNALSLSILGTGKRVAHAFERKPTFSPLLYVEYIDVPGN